MQSMSVFEDEQAIFGIHVGGMHGLVTLGSGGFKYLVEARHLI